MSVILDGTNSEHVKFAHGLSGTTTHRLYYEVKTTDNQFMVVAARDGNINQWQGAATEGSASSAGISDIKLDGVSLSTGLTRDQLHDVIATDTWHTIEAVVEHNSNAHVIGVGYHGTGTSPFGFSGQFRNFKVDINNTGSWTNQSWNGNTDGFVLTGGDVIDDEPEPESSVITSTLQTQLETRLRATL